MSSSVADQSKIQDTSDGAKHTNLHKLAYQNDSLGISNVIYNGLTTLEEKISCDKSSVIQLCLTEDDKGNYPAMIAANQQNNEMLISLLSPFINLPHKLKYQHISTLIHHRNKEGKSLLEIVTEKPTKSMSTSEGMLIEFEGLVHDWNHNEFQKCIRSNLGTTIGAMKTLQLFKRCSKRRTQKTGCATLFATFIKSFTLLFLLRSFFYALDVVSDCVVLAGHFDDWQNKNFSLGSNMGRMMPDVSFRLQIEIDLTEKEDSDCKEMIFENQFLTKSINNSDMKMSNFERVLEEMAIYNVPLECYPDLVSEKMRFILTALFILMPTILHIFEMIISEMECATTTKHQGSCRIIIWGATKLLASPILWLSMPFATFFREFWLTFRFQAEKDVEKLNFYRKQKEDASWKSSRVKIIEVCTESSFQPLFQLYLVYMSLMNWALGQGSAASRDNDGRFHLIVNHHWREILSVSISIFSLAWGYTSHYRRTKNCALGTIATFVYFFGVLLFIITRILCFEMFAYFLGPGNFVNAITIVIVHVFLMSVIHYVFSYSVEQCKTDLKDEHVSRMYFGIHFRSVYASFINGLANIFVYNDIEDKENVNNLELSESKDIEMCMKSKLSTPNHFSSFKRKDKSQHLVRRFLIEVILLLENIAMITLAKRISMTTISPHFKHIYNYTVFFAMGSFLIAVILKFLFYVFFHPWSALIRQKQKSFLSNK